MTLPLNFILKYIFGYKISNSKTIKYNNNSYYYSLLTEKTHLKNNLYFICKNTTCSIKIKLKFIASRNLIEIKLFININIINMVKKLFNHYNIIIN